MLRPRSIKASVNVVVGVVAVCLAGCESIAGLERTTFTAPEIDDDAGATTVAPSDAEAGACAPEPRASGGGTCAGALLTLTPASAMGEASSCSREVPWGREDYAVIVVDTRGFAHGTLTLTLRVASGEGHVSFDLFGECATLPTAAQTSGALISRDDVGPRATATMVAHFLKGQAFQLGVTGAWVRDGGVQRENRWSVTAVVTPD